ncbi:MAG: glycosyltransferase family 2 protein [Paracoccaceae bacterium]
MKITAITRVGNEGPFLLEWIAFNRIIGVTDFLIYSEDAEDGSAPLLDTLQDNGIVQHIPLSSMRPRMRNKHLKHARQQDIVAHADWVWIATVEEFPNIHTGNGTLPDLINACGNPQAISLSHQYISNDDIQDFEDTPVTGQFMHSHNPDLWGEHLSIDAKTLVRNDFPLHYYGAYRPFFKADAVKGRLPVWKDGSGRDVPKQYMTASNPLRIRQFPAAGARHFATLNQYALRSVDSFLVKSAAGDPSGDNQVFDARFWQDRNDDSYFDDSILRYIPRLEAELKHLKSDPKVAGYHHATVALHNDRIEKLMADRAFASLRVHLLTSPKTPLNETHLDDQLSRGVSL